MSVAGRTPATCASSFGNPGTRGVPGIARGASSAGSVVPLVLLPLSAVALQPGTAEGVGATLRGTSAACAPGYVPSTSWSARATCAGGTHVGNTRGTRSACVAGIPPHTIGGADATCA